MSPTSETSLPPLDAPSRRSVLKRTAAFAGMLLVPTIPGTASSSEALGLETKQRPADQAFYANQDYPGGI